jgi:glycerol-3-phosphate acyltransferase PlsX
VPVVAVDLLGGDHGPDVVVQGALAALVRRQDLRVLLVGPPDAAAAALARPHDQSRVQLVSAHESVRMDEDPVRAVRARRDATVRVAARLVRDGTADATVSVGSTGAAAAAAIFTLGRLPGITRPALAVAVHASLGPLVFLDAGATVDGGVDVLAQFALCGVAYCQAHFDVESPRVGLLSIGTEPGKGDALRRQATELLGLLPMTFIGNVEPNALLAGGVADVVVTDGFTGNLVLKSIEATLEAVGQRVDRSESDGSAASAGGADRYGVPDATPPTHLTGLKVHSGAVLLGVDGVCVVGHGASGPASVESAILLAAETAERGVVDRVRSAISELVAARRAAAGLPEGSLK